MYNQRILHGGGGRRKLIISYYLEREKKNGGKKNKRGGREDRKVLGVGEDAGGGDTRGRRELEGSKRSHAGNT